MTDNTKQHKNVLERIAQILSDFFSPIVVPTYGTALALWITPLSILPERIRFGVMAMIALITAVIPTATIVTMIRLGRVSDMSISNRRERFIPFMVTIACYVAAAIYLGVVHAPAWLSLFFIGAAVSTLIAMLINFGWKISAHATSAGGLAGIVSWLAFNHLAIGNAAAWVSGSVVLVGLIATSRLILNRHTLGQVCAGAALGFAVEFILLSL